MKQIFWGMFFIHLNFSFTLNNNYVLGLIPAFVGYFILRGGLTELAVQSNMLQKALPFTLPMGICTAILWVGDLLGIWNGIGIGVLTGLAVIAINYYVSYLVVEGIRELERGRNAFLYGDQLHKVWLITLGLNLAIYAAIFIPVVRLLTILAGLVLEIYFVVLFYRAWKLYDNLPLNGESSGRPDWEF